MYSYKIHNDNDYIYSLPHLFVYHDNRAAIFPGQNIIAHILDSKSWISFYENWCHTRDRWPVDHVCRYYMYVQVPRNTHRSHILHAGVSFWLCFRLFGLVGGGGGGRGGGGGGGGRGGGEGVGEGVGGGGRGGGGVGRGWGEGGWGGGGGGEGGWGGGGGGEGGGEGGGGEGWGEGGGGGWGVGLEGGVGGWEGGVGGGEVGGGRFLDWLCVDVHLWLVWFLAISLELWKPFSKEFVLRCSRLVGILCDFFNYGLGVQLGLWIICHFLCCFLLAVCVLLDVEAFYQFAGSPQVQVYHITF